MEQNNGELSIRTWRAFVVVSWYYSIAMSLELGGCNSRLFSAESHPERGATCCWQIGGATVALQDRYRGPGLTAYQNWHCPVAGGEPSAE